VTSRFPTTVLAEVCEVFADGDWVESKDQSQHGIRLIQTGNVGIGIFKGRDEKSRYVSEDTFTRLRCTEIFEGDCLISRLPEPVGRSCIIPATGERMITAVDCTIVRFRPSRMLPEFFNYYSQSVEYLRAVDSETTGTTRKRVSRSRLGQVSLPVPPLKDQRRIVSILDEAFGAIVTARADAEHNLLKARELFQSLLNAAVSGGSEKSGNGWDLKPLGDSFDITSSRRVIVRLAQQGYVENELFISEEMFSRYSARYGIPTAGDIMVTGVGTLGICYVVREQDRFYFKDGNIIWLKKKSATDSRFVEYAFQSDFVRRQIDDSVGATVGTFTIIKAKGTLIPVPPLPEQQRIVEHLDAVSGETRRLRILYERKIAALDDLKRSLLHQAFTGAL
jgi:type I restriction enzyme, S subunit